MLLNPTGGGVKVGNDGPIHDDVTLHVQTSDFSVSSSDIQDEDIIVEDNNAWLGLYSDDGGGIASGITLGEKQAGGSTPLKRAIYARTAHNAGDLNITYGTNQNPGGNEQMLQISPEGHTKVKVLEIEGMDVAERFPVSDSAEPGMVVEIDPNHPGKLRVARGAYNRRVAGIVSGAGDIPVGAILGSELEAEGAPPIALSGRVWVNCDAREQDVRPGDLLTSSSLAGHAMKATDSVKAQGAIIGKAMGSLTGATGLVLVLVSLQ